MEGTPNYIDYTLWSLSYSLYSASEKDYLEIDPFIETKINDNGDLNAISSGLRHVTNINCMPLTMSKIDKIVNLVYDSAETINDLSEMCRWISEKTKQRIVSQWLDGTQSSYYSFPRPVVLSAYESYKEKQNDIMSKLIIMYRNGKRHYVYNVIAELFTKVCPENLEKCCEIISSATPLIKTIFLKRGDLLEKYIVMGVKSLSKISSQKNIDIKLDFNILSKLGPSSRLKAMKQLLGMFDRYYINMIYYQTIYHDQYMAEKWKKKFETCGKTNIPFKNIPTKEEVAQFLFPCSIKYNDEVSKLVAKYEYLLKLIEEKPKEEENG